MNSHIVKCLIILMPLGLLPNRQPDDASIRKKVLDRAIIDSTFIFGKWTEHGGTETHLTYLGSVTTRNGKTFKIINSVWLWGLSHRATSRILVFNSKNQYVGKYNVSVTTDLPTKMVNGKLIFKNTSKECDRRIFTIVDLNKGLPIQFFRKCKGDNGDIYGFDTD